MRGVGIDQQVTQGIEADEVERLERDLIPRQGLQCLRNGGQCGLLSLVDGGGEWVVFGLAGGEDAVDDQVLLGQADGGKFFMGACRLAQRGALRTGHQHEASTQGIGQRLHRSLVLAALFFQARQRPQTRRIAFACLQKSAPCARQLQQADCVACGGCVEDDMRVILCQRRIGQQGRELVEGGDFRGASTRQGFFDAIHYRIG